MTAVVLAIAIRHRAPVIVLALVIGALEAPVPTAAILLGIVAATVFGESRRSGVDPAVGVVVGVAGDLRAGRPLRAVVASGAFGDELAVVARRGLPIRAAGTRSLSMFGDDAPLVAATLDLAVDIGGPVAATFDRLAAGMIEAERTRRERRAAMAPAVAQATVVGGVPVIALVQMVVSGRWIGLLAAGPASASMALGGAAAVIGGVAWIVVMVVGRR